MRKRQRWLAPIALAGAMVGLGTACQPTPDYKLIALDIPPSAAVLLIGFKSDDDVVSATSLAVPVAGLSADARVRYSMGISLPDLMTDGGVLSIATVDTGGCLTSVVSTDRLQRSSATSVSAVEVELDPQKNDQVVQTNPAYAPPVQCLKVPGLGMPTEPTPVPRQPLFINAIRRLNGPAGAFDSGEISVYGWGMDRGQMTVPIATDPLGCFTKLAVLTITKYPQYTPLFMSLWAFKYPNLQLVSYARLELQVAQLKSMFQPQPAPAELMNGLIQCIAESTLAFNFTTTGGQTAHFTEMLP